MFHEGGEANKEAALASIIKEGPETKAALASIITAELASITIEFVLFIMSSIPSLAPNQGPTNRRTTYTATPKTAECIIAACKGDTFFGTLTNIPGISTKNNRALNMLRIIQIFVYRMIRL
jgi:hypothetical protein